MITKFIQLSVMITIVTSKMDPICKMDAPVGVDPETCCKVPDMLDHATLEKCALLVFNNNSSDISAEIINKNSGQCLIECIFKEYGIFKNSSVLPDVALKLLTEVMDSESDSEWIPIVKNAMDTCQTMAINSTKTMDDGTATNSTKTMEEVSATNSTKPMEDGACSSLPAFYFGCFHTQLFKNCPSSKWTSNDGCNQLRNNAEKCPILTAVISMD